MEMNTTLVEDFLNGNGTVVHRASGYPVSSDSSDGGRVEHGHPPVSSSACPGPYGAAPMPAEFHGGMSMVDAFALQERLVTVMNEAQSIIAQLQQFGMFPKGGNGTDPNAAANLLLMSLLSANQNNGALGGMYAGPIAAPTPQVGEEAMPVAWESPSPVVTQKNPQSPSGELLTMLCDPAQERSAGPAAQREQPPPSRYFDFHGLGTLAPHGYESGALPLSDALEAPTEPVTRGRQKKRGGASNGNGSGRGREEHFGSGNGGVGHGHEYTKNGGGSGRGNPPSRLAFVEFKRGRVRKYICDDESIEPGTYVLVDGDRGTDCGLLVQTIQNMPDGETSVICMDGCNINDEKLKLENGRVLRAASNEDIDRLHNIIANAETVALKTCRQRCQELGIDIELLDVEYQFDMKKISFFFDCDHSVDFRSLVRELYRTFGARIWMENINPKVKNAMPEQPREGDHGNGGRNHHGGGGRRRY